MPHVQFSVLGPLLVRRESTGQLLEVPIPGDRARRALALLVVEAGRPVPVDRLIDEIWEAPPDGAANALQSLVSRLRRALGEEAPIERDGDAYRLAVPPSSVDAWRLQRAVEAARSGELTGLEGALSEWRGEPLAGLGSGGSLDTERRRLRELHRAGQSLLAAARLEAGGDATLAGDLEVLCAANPLDEELHRLLLRALLLAGREADALTRYEHLRQRLREELGADPAPALQELHRAILQHDPAVRRHDPAPARTVETNLRRTRTSFVGREDDLRALSGLLAERRLVTIVGPGGAGKTRLSQEVAWEQREHFPDGVWVVELAPLREGRDVTRAILAALEPHVGALADLARSVPGDPLLGLVFALHERRTLLVLDNCEQVAARCAEIADAVLGGTSGVSILATSREPLGVPDEQLWPIGSLDTGDQSGDAAVQLFLDRARAVRPTFAIDDAGREVVRRICTQLDGLPLAIELAAARLRTLTLTEIEGRLADRFRLLTSQRRVGSERHQTLRAVVDWSWELLEPVEQTLLRRLSVFSEAGDLAAVEGCCAGLGGPDDVPRDQILEVLSALVDRSLVVVETRGDRTSYRLLETVRAYAADRLRESGEGERAREAHARHFTELAEAAHPHLRSHQQLVWLERLDASGAELRAAIIWATQAGRKELALRLGTALGWYVDLRGLHRRHRAWVEDALALPGEVPPLVRARALTALVSFGLNPDADARRDLQHVQEARAAYAEAGVEPPEELRFREVSSRLEMLRNDPDAGEQLRADLATFRGEGADPWLAGASWVIDAFSRTGGMPPEERAARVEEAFEHAVEGLRRAGDDWGLAGALAGLAVCVEARGDRTTAFAHLDEAFRRSSRVGWSEDVLWVLIGVTATLAMRSGGWGEREPGAPELDTVLQHGLEQAQSLGASSTGVAAGYVFLGALAQRRGAVELAGRCYALALEQELPESADARSPVLITATCGLAWVRHREGDQAGAWAALVQAGATLRELGESGLGRRPAGTPAQRPEVDVARMWLAGVCRLGAGVLLDAGLPERALTLFGAVEPLQEGVSEEQRAQFQEGLPPGEPGDAELEERARAMLPPPTADAALARGAAMHSEDLLAALEHWPPPHP